MSTPIDVLAVLETQAALVDWLTKEEIAGDPLRRVQAAVAELIEAASDHVNGGAIGAVARKERLLAALARVKGGAQ